MAPRFVWNLAASIGFPLGGAAAAAALLSAVILPRIQLGDVERIRQLARHVTGEPLSGSTVIFLGNSITMEGLDTSQLGVGQPDWQAENYAITGCGLSEYRIILPKLLKRNPVCVVLAFDPMTLQGAADIPADKAFAYAMAGFVEDWPASWTADDFPGLDRATYDILRSNYMRQLLHFRTAPLIWINYRSRAAVRGDLRTDSSYEWRAPYTMLESVDQGRTQFQLRALAERYRQASPIPSAGGVDLLRRTCILVRDSGARLVFVMTPVHPDVRTVASPLLEGTRQTLREMSAEYGGVLLEADGVLESSEFADSVHPNEAGRRIYSELIGRQVFQTLESTVESPPPPAAVSR